MLYHEIKNEQKLQDIIRSLPKFISSKERFSHVEIEDGEQLDYVANKLKSLINDDVLEITTDGDGPYILSIAKCVKTGNTKSRKH